MKRIYFDTEFIQHQVRLKGRVTPVMELISIGLVDGQGREYSGVSNQFNLAAARANPWVNENVVRKLPPRGEWKSRAQLRSEVLAFIGDEDVQMVHWQIGHDAVLFDQLIADGFLQGPQNIDRLPYNLGQLWDDLGCPDILPEQDKSEEHQALSDARWLRDVDRAISGYIRSFKPG